MKATNWHSIFLKRSKCQISSLARLIRGGYGITSQLSVQSIKLHHLYVGNIGTGTCLDISGRYDINYTFGTRQSCRKCVNWLIWMNGIDRPIEKENDSPIDPVIILYMRPANERRRYSVTSSLIGWAHTQDDPCRPWDKLNNWEVWSITVQLTNWNQNHPEYPLFVLLISLFKLP